MNVCSWRTNDCDLFSKNACSTLCVVICCYQTHYYLLKHLKWSPEYEGERPAWDHLSWLQYTSGMIWFIVLCQLQHGYNYKCWVVGTQSMFYLGRRDDFWALSYLFCCHFVMVLASQMILLEIWHATSHIFVRKEEKLESTTVYSTLQCSVVSCCCYAVLWLVKMIHWNVSRPKSYSASAGSVFVMIWVKLDPIWHQTPAMGSALQTRHLSYNHLISIPIKARVFSTWSAKNGKAQAN